MKKKVFFFLPNTVGGAERMTINIAKMLDQDDNSIHFVIVGKSLGRIEELIPHRYRISLLYVKKIWHLGTVKLIKCLYENRPDIVFSSIMYLNARLVFASKIVGNIKTIIRNDNSLNIISGVTKLLIKIAYPMADVIISQQDAMTEELCSMHGVSANRVKTLYNPLDTELVEEKLKNARSPYSGTGCVNYVNVATIDKRKGQDVLLKAFHRYHNENRYSHLYFVGMIGDNSYYKQLESYIQANGLDEFVHFIGYTNNPYKWMKFADCFVLSSRIEGLPNTLIEANYLKVPCVSTSCIPAIKMILEEESNGYIVPVDDYEAMAVAMKRALSLSNIPLTYCPSSAEEYRNLFK